MDINLQIYERLSHDSFLTGIESTLLSACVFVVRYKNILEMRLGKY